MRSPGRGRGPRRCRWRRRWTGRARGRTGRCAAARPTRGPRAGGEAPSGEPAPPAPREGVARGRPRPRRPGRALAERQRAAAAIVPFRKPRRENRPFGPSVIARPSLVCPSTAETVTAAQVSRDSPPRLRHGRRNASRGRRAARRAELSTGSEKSQPLASKRARTRTRTVARGGPPTMRPALPALVACVALASTVSAPTRAGDVRVPIPSSCDVRDHGATGARAQNATTAVQKAIDACHAAGGGTGLRSARRVHDRDPGSQGQRHPVAGGGRGLLPEPGQGRLPARAGPRVRRERAQRRDPRPGRFDGQARYEWGLPEEHGQRDLRGGTARRRGRRRPAALAAPRAAVDDLPLQALPRGADRGRHAWSARRCGTCACGAATAW